jgi:hypothetical protein
MTEGSNSWYIGKLIQSDCGWLSQFGLATYIPAAAGVCKPEFLLEFQSGNRD